MADRAKMRREIARFKYLALFLAAGFGHVAFAPAASVADTSPERAPSWQAEAQKELKSANYEAAIKVLQTANDSASADWNNLIGYAMRLKNPPDLMASETFYKAALKIDPAHKGALEYYGELLLMKNDLAGAEQMLARLDKICFFSCEEFRDLKQAIATHKAKPASK
jgi:Flp pilus assembly protein TadD